MMSNNSELDNKVEAVLLLHNGYSVSKFFYDRIKGQVEDIVPAMDQDVSYTLEMLCGMVFWDALSVKERHTAGRCMADMVEGDIFPMDFVGCEHVSPKRYRLK